MNRNRETVQGHRRLPLLYPFPIALTTSKRISHGYPLPFVDADLRLLSGAVALQQGVLDATDRTDDNHTAIHQRGEQRHTMTTFPGGLSTKARERWAWLLASAVEDAERGGDLTPDNVIAQIRYHVDDRMEKGKPAVREPHHRALVARLHRELKAGGGELRSYIQAALGLAGGGRYLL